MPLWIKISLGLVASLILVFALIMTWAIWMIRVPSLNILRDDPQAAEKLEEWFLELRSGRLKKFNGVVLVRRGEDVLLRNAYGTDAQGRPLTPHSSLRLASVSKQFTAVGLLTLVQKDRVDLEAPVSKYLPACPFDSTVRSLLNHTSGIPDNIYSLAAEEAVLTLPRVEELVCGEPTDLAAPGFSYSNTGYLLAARIIERVSGQSFEDYMQTAVFDPLGMDHTRVWNLVSTREFPDRAAGFNGARRTKPPMEPGPLDGVAGDGGVFSSLTDLENWDRFWSDKRLLSAGLKQMALEGGEHDYGFGWVRDGNVAWHNGSWLAARTLIARNMLTGDFVVVLDNSNNVMFDKIADELRNMISD